MSRREAKKQEFYQALRDSLSDLIEKGGKRTITQTAVIENAVYPSGKKVGETTLFGKTKTNGYIHQEFMTELDKLIKAANKRPKKSANKSLTTSEKLENKRSDYAELKEEYDTVLAQFAQMMERKKDVNNSSNENRVRTLEADLYLVASLLMMRIDVDIPEITSMVENYEKKHSGQERLALVKERVSRIERRIRDSKITPIFGTMNES